jgi:DNA-binding CsgD family transcriptional regulator
MTNLCDWKRKAKLWDLLAACSEQPVERVTVSSVLLLGLMEILDAGRVSMGRLDEPQVDSVPMTVTLAEVLPVYLKRFREHPVLEHARKTRCPSAFRISDLMSDRQYLALPIARDCLIPVGNRHQALLPLRVGHERNAYYLTASRPDKDFSSADLSLMDEIGRPLRHLMASLARAEQRRHATILTMRETQVMELVSQGLTNEAVAVVLQISVGTVRKHMENIRVKYDTPTRTGAVGAWLAEQSGDATATIDPEAASSA